MLQKSPREERFGCLFGLVGGFIGFFIGARMDAAAGEAMRAAEPDAIVDFLPVMAIAGIFCGGLVAALFGMVLSRLTPPKRPGV
jgi:hypothetical protein